MTGGEQDNKLALWRQMIDNNAVDIYRPDICYLGGIERTLCVVRMAAESGKMITPRTAELMLATNFTLRLTGGGRKRRALSRVCRRGNRCIILSIAEVTTHARPPRASGVSPSENKTDKH